MINKFTSKHFILTVVSFMLILTLVCPVLAAEPAAQPYQAGESEEPVLISAPVLPDYVTYNATVKEVMIEDDVVVGLLADVDGSEERFNIFEDTVIIDNEKGTASSLSSLKPGEVVFVYGSPMKTRSIPPQSRAIVVLTNIDVKAPAKYLTVMSIDQDAAGDLKVYDSNCEYIVTITKETVLLPYLTKQIVKTDDIKVGSKILVWSEIMTASLPAQMTADRVVLLPEEATPLTGKIIISQMAGVISVNGQEVTPEGDELFYSKHGTLMVPLRKVAEALGYEVQWIQDGRRIELKKDAQLVKLQINNQQYNDSHLTIAPELTNSTTFVPIEFLEEVLKIEVSVNNHHV